MTFLRPLLFLCACIFLFAGTVQADEETVSQTACEHEPYSILVTVQNVKQAKGTITADLHDNQADHFLKGRFKLERIRVPAVVGETKMCIPIAKPGIYAVVLYHDRNANMEFDKTWVGLPDEPYGVSNNPKIRLGPPTLEEAAFDVNGPLTPITVVLHN